MLSLLLIVFLISIATSASHECDNARAGPFVNWIIYHEDCWGTCVKTGNKVSNNYALTNTQKSTSCGNRPVKAYPNTQTNPQPNCGWVFGKKKQLRAYCGREPNYLAPSINGGQHRGSPNCGTEVCFNGGTAFNHDQYCRTGNFLGVGDGADISSSLPCPHGTTAVSTAACREGVTMFQQQHVCRVDVQSVTFTDLNASPFAQTVNGYFTVVTSTASTRWSPDGTPYTGAHLAFYNNALYQYDDDGEYYDDNYDDDGDDDEYYDDTDDEFERKTNLRRFKNELRKARISMMKEKMHKKHNHN